MIRAITATVLALGFAGTALADRRDDDRWDRHDRGHQERRHDWRHDRYDDRRDHRYGRYDRQYRYSAPRYDYRWRSPRPRGWYPGWREPYGRGYRYWNENYYYVVPDSPSVNLSFAIPLR